MPAEPNAVYFAHDDYAHVWRRVGVFLIDLAVLLPVAFAATLPITFLMTPKSALNVRDATQLKEALQPRLRKAFPLGWLCAGVPYHIGLRKLRGGTVGYRLMGVRIVDQTGHTPSWRALTKRFLLAGVLVPLWFVPLILSYLYGLKHPKRQAGHDFWSGTWVVKKKAQPAGPAMTAYQSKLLGTLLLNYIDVEPYTPKDAVQGATDGRPDDGLRGANQQPAQLC